MDKNDSRSYIHRRHDNGKDKGRRGTSLTEIKGRSQECAGMERVVHHRALSGRPGGRCSSGRQWAS